MEFFIYPLIRPINKFYATNLPRLDSPNYTAMGIIKQPSAILADILIYDKYIYISSRE